MSFWRASCVSLMLAGLGHGALASAAPWAFEKPVTVAAAQPRVFHHLEASGRASIAVSSGTVAIAWEDNRDGTARAYVAFRTAGTAAFKTLRLSGAGEAYEPSVAALPGGRFVFAWEEAGAVWARSGGPDGLDPPVRLSRAPAAQASVASGERGVYAAWSERDGPQPVIRFAMLHAGAAGAALVTDPPVAVTASAPAGQSYPALAVLTSAVVVAFEDRREGHTVLLAARTVDGRHFDKAQLLNEQRPRRSQVFGRGTGAARVALARLDDEHAAAVWLDKRDFEGGYDVYAALSDAGGVRFGRNEKVQDEFGNDIAQWHACLAAHRGLLVAAWDDDRDGSPDLWLSWREGGAWVANLAVPGAAESGPDTSPAIALDEAGNLHLAWIAQDGPGAPTRLMYLEGRRARVH